MEDLKINCPWCNGNAKLVYKNFPSKTTNIYRCEKCKIMFQSPLPSEEEIFNMYSEEYFSSWGDNDFLEVTKKGDFKRYIKLIEKFNTTNEKKLLDIGTAQGFLLEVAQERGWDVKGIEMSHSVKVSNKKIKDKIIYGDFLKLNFQKEEFSAITSISLFEHIREPKKFTRKVHYILKSEGLWLVLVPNIDSFQRKILGKRWPHFNPPHLFYYNFKFFEFLCSENGFEIIYKKIPYTNYSLSYISNQISLNSSGIFSSIAKILRNTLPHFFLQKEIKISGGNLLVLLRKIS